MDWQKSRNIKSISSLYQAYHNCHPLIFKPSFHILKFTFHVADAIVKLVSDGNPAHAKQYKWQPSTCEAMHQLRNRNTCHFFAFHQQKLFTSACTSRLENI